MKQKLALSIGLLALLGIVAVGTGLLNTNTADARVKSKALQELVNNRQEEEETMSDTLEMNENMSGLKWHDSVVGEGDAAAPGKRVSVHYSGWLYPSGEKFDSSLDRGTPFEFRLGAGQVIKGWDEGVNGMKIGGKRTLVIPPDMGYGSRGVPGAIPENATLKFDVELLGVE